LSHIVKIIFLVLKNLHFIIAERRPAILSRSWTIRPDRRPFSRILIQKTSKATKRRAFILHHKMIGPTPVESKKTPLLPLQVTDSTASGKM
jgi:hypothetical protein